MIYIIALRYTLHPPKTGGSGTIKGLRPSAPPVRLFVLGARAESSLPRDVWTQLAHLFPDQRIHLILIGPESMANRDDEFPLPPRTAHNPFSAVVEDRVWATMKITTIVNYWHEIYKTQYFHPFDPYFDCFVLFHPGLGHPASSHEWRDTVPMLLETKTPIIVTGYTQYDMERDIAWVHKTMAGEFDMLLEPGENRFRSLRWDLNDVDPQDISAGNWGVWAFRGKRYVLDEKSESISVLFGLVADLCWWCTCTDMRPCANEGIEKKKAVFVGPIVQSVEVVVGACALSTSSPPAQSGRGGTKPGFF